ncbi:chemotaxis protein [Arcobacter sp. CECT 8983]|uniref:methyl-accepting chemotaxis protein n=1 Tax=Arcobacter sp. CECT 8983 TaxID=2044508 RepID=UPI00100B3FD3|nr:methyl-accepting chemotaxis protein [Arcobacter sp. CECT 8983]RXJ91756.1 chemotaxis protein [Arcobacter sp. CECT 8983]
MYKNLSSKAKLLINMILAQLGFAVITTTAIITSNDLVAILIVNLFFAIIVGYMNFAAMKRITGGIDRFKKYMDDIMDFVFMRTNRIEKAKYMKNDEIGLILTEMNSYVDKIDIIRKDDMRVLGEVVLTMDKVSRGTYKCRINSQSKNFMIKALRDTINKMLDITESNMNELKTSLEKYANDDYREKINISPELTDDMLNVMESINILGESLSTNAKKNFENGQKLEKNSISMNNSVRNVAHKANEQAASLEETAAALEEITSITRNNTNNATQMATLSGTVQKSVENGQVLASKTAQSMEEINEEVASINEAITVIDQIAFQTNILSLNAAVEAATAGEAGKGFAVVAQEVRNLANRSAEAAKEIKSIVEKARDKTAEGKDISNSMIKGYEELNSHMKETLEIIADVSSASKEQMTGIEQINNTVSMLDRVTQENASEANNVTQVANDTLSMANELVNEAKQKQFN